jgi:hypothetical protein
MKVRLSGTLISPDSLFRLAVEASRIPVETVGFVAGLLPAMDTAVGNLENFSKDF